MIANSGVSVDMNTDLNYMSYYFSVIVITIILRYSEAALFSLCFHLGFSSSLSAVYHEYLRYPTWNKSLSSTCKTQTFEKKEKKEKKEEKKEKKEEKKGKACF